MSKATIYIVDDDAGVRDSLAAMLQAAGLAAACYADGSTFLASWRNYWRGCVVLDLQLGDMHGTDVQAALAERGSLLPIIFLTAHGDIPTTVSAIKHGAMDFLTKPVRGALLIDRVSAALAHERTTHAERERLAQLTQREREILQLALAGHSNKAIARQLGISHRTVEFHRSRILSKTGATSLLQLANGHGPRKAP